MTTRVYDFEVALRDVAVLAERRGGRTRKKYGHPIQNFTKSKVSKVLKGPIDRAFEAAGES
jgi:hypothetical protein